MRETVRTFIAVKIEPCESLAVVITRLSALGRPVKAIALDKLHVTLKFLGDTEKPLIDEITTVLGDVVRDKQTFEFELCGLGAFPHLTRPTVIWAGMRNTETLSVIAVKLDMALTQLGFQRETKPFRPHLTLARVKSKPPAQLRAIVDEHQSTQFGTALIASVEFIQSELRPDGPRYTTLSSAELRW